MRDEIERFVASLAIPGDRKAVVAAELADHVACATEAAVREGRDGEAAGREALGNLEALRRSLEAIEPAFRVSRCGALVRGGLAGLLVAIVVDLWGTVAFGTLAAVVALALALVFAPPRVFELLRAELRARPVRGRVLRGVPIGPGVTYAYTVMSVPFLVWIAMIVERARAGVTALDVPASAFVLMFATLLVLFVEKLRAWRTAAA